MRRKVIIPNERLFADVEKMVSNGERVTLLTKGQSMLPFIVGGRDSVELSRVDGDIERGDILLVRLPHTTTYIIHRVIEIEGEEITLMGDGNLVGVEQCRREDVIAKVITIIKPNKKIDPYSRQQRRYCKLWRGAMPIRRYILAITRRLKKLQ